MITLSKSELSNNNLRGSEPILVLDGLATWPAASLWSPQLLASMVGTNAVDVSVSLTGAFRYNPDGSAMDPDNQFVIPNVSLAKAVDFIGDQSRMAPKYYIAQHDLVEKLPALLEHLRFPEQAATSRINLWFGSGGTITPLHFDRAHNLYAQIYGSKTFTIFDPVDTQFLYPHPEDSRLGHLSYLDIDNPNDSVYPLFRKARPCQFIITPGQLLFLPALWWHHVRSNSVSISANQWWAPETKPPPA